MPFLLQLNSMLNKPVCLKQKDFYLIKYFYQSEISTLVTAINLLTLICLHSSVQNAELGAESVLGMHYRSANPEL